MIAALGYCLRDQEAALELARWIEELGGCPSHELFLIHDPRCDKNSVQVILDTFIRSFKAVYNGVAPAEIDGWPEGANYFMRLVSDVLGKKSQYKEFLWLEPDSIPLVSGWMDKLEAEYRAAGKPFMGDRVEVGDIPLHMSGVGIYHNPLHRLAGEAYRAHDVAWDMAAREQIIPNAHFTKLIEHAWQHPSFTMMSELQTQIRFGAVLFHSSKDGSLIRLLREKILGKRGVEISMGGPEERSTGGLSEAETKSEVLSTSRHDAGPPTSLSGGLSGGHGVADVIQSTPLAQNFTCDIFIRTYEGDYQWLEYCIKAIDKFCTGFRKIWIASPHNPPVWMLNCGVKIDWKVVNDETEDGYLAQQITKLYADVITDYGADYILHVDSDVIFNQHVTPTYFLWHGEDREEKVIWPFTMYSSVETPWQPIIEKFMGCSVAAEFMRRFPVMIPRWLYPRLREFCHRQHGMPLCDYVRNQPLRSFSEFNALGAYAQVYHTGKFHWVNTELESLPPPVARQFHSWGGITPEVKTEIEQIFSAAVPVLADPITHTPTQVSGETRESTASEQSVTRTDSRGGSGENVPHGIKELPNGIWVIEGDTHISKWIEQEGRLDHDMNSLPDILPHINEGDVVVDGGAFVGDHTLAYLRKVGATGEVHAFEPNPLAMECLQHNLGNCQNGGHSYRLKTYNVALGDTFKPNLSLSGNNNNYGGSYLGSHMPITDKVTMMALDEFQLEPDFVKLDLEGCEMKALLGMGKTIKRCRPKMVIEINEVALARQGSTPNEILLFLQYMSYTYTVLQPNCKIGDPMYDILCLPLGKFPSAPEEQKRVREEDGDESKVDSEPKAPGEPLSLEQMSAALAEHAAKGTEQKKYVRKLLRKHHVIPKPRKAK